MSVPSGLNVKTNINEMTIGDCIPCRYTSLTSGTPGNFSELGTSTASEIPVTGFVIPDGTFYFIMVEPTLLIADRVVQINVSWNALNNAKFIEGLLLNLSEIDYSKKVNLGTVTINSFTSAWSGYSPSFMFDNIKDVTTNAWHPLNNTNANNCTFSLPNKITFNCIVLKCRNSTYIPMNFKVYGVNDLGSNVLLNMDSTIRNDLLILITKESITDYSKFYISMNAGYFAIEELEFLELDDINENVLIRSLSGGCTYVDENGNMSLTDKSLGAWPVNNEWDKYIVNSDLGGKITPGDDNVWHFNILNNLGKQSWTKDTSMTGVSFPSTTGTAFNKIIRPTLSNNPITVNAYSSTSAIANIGFRPVLQLKHSKQTNLWY